MASDEPIVSDIFRYPVKSCRGEALASTTVEPWGLAGDRRWMLVGADGEAVTAREHPPLVLVTPRRDGDILRLSRPGVADLEVPVPGGPDSSRQVSLRQVTVWRNEVLAAEASDQAHAWFTELVGEPVRLMYLDDPTRRRPNPAYSQPGDRVSFADGYPVLLTTTGSLAALNELINDGPHSGEGPLPMMRFRPNVVVSGTPEWAEDKWRRVRIGSVEFRVARSCVRCVLTTIDPDTAAKGREPLAALARHRRWDGGVWFGVNMIPDRPGDIAVGDEFQILE